MQNFRKYIPANWFYLLPPVIFIIVSASLIIHNGSFIFEESYLDRVGDQRLYHSFAYKLIHGVTEKSYYTMGYPLLLMPLILLTGIQDSWTSIMTPLIIVQSFMIIPLSVYIIMKNKSRIYSIVTMVMMFTYFAVWLISSQDILIKYTFLGLMPLSEPLSILLLLLSYQIYLKHFRGRPRPERKYTLLLSGTICWSLLTRNVSAILYLPIFLDLLIDRRYRQIIHIALWTGLLYMPQLIYNYLCSGQLLFNGYVWKSHLRAEKNSRIIEALYGFKSNALFSSKYMLANVKELLPHYSSVIFTIALLKTSIMKHRFVMLVGIASAINIIFFLSYWWSRAGGLMDRFMLPNMFLLFYIFQNRLIDNKMAKEK